MSDFFTLFLVFILSVTMTVFITTTFDKKAVRQPKVLVNVYKNCKKVRETQYVKDFKMDNFFKDSEEKLGYNYSLYSNSVNPLKIKNKLTSKKKKGAPKAVNHFFA